MNQRLQTASNAVISVLQSWRTRHGRHTYLQQDCYTIQRTCQRPGPWVTAKCRAEIYAQLRLVARIFVWKARRAMSSFFSIHARNRQPVVQRRNGTQATLKPGCRTIATAMGNVFCLYRLFLNKHCVRRALQFEPRVRVR